MLERMLWRQRAAKAAPFSRWPMQGQGSARLLAGLSGRKRTECAYCKSDVTDLPYFTQKVVFGEGGIVKVLPIGELNEYETKRPEEAKAQLKSEIESGLKYAEANSLA